MPAMHGKTLFERTFLPSARRGAQFCSAREIQHAHGVALSIRCNTHNAFLHSLRNDLEQPRERDSARHMGSAQYLGCAQCAPVSLPACLPARLGRLQNVFLRTRTGQRTQAHERQAAVCRCSCCMLLKVFPSFPSLPIPPFPSAAPGGCVSSSVAKTKADRCC